MLGGVIARLQCPDLGLIVRRPGDTIHIDAGTHAAAGVQLTHPLQLVGQPGSQLLCGPHKAEAALLVHANVRMEAVNVAARRAACIQQHAGRMRLVRCMLHCDPQRFDHLYSALVTLARSSQAHGQGCNASIDLSVEETAISGCFRAIRCCGDGQLQGVRMCSDGRQQRFWFAVCAQHSSLHRPGTVQDSFAACLQPGQESAGSTRTPKCPTEVRTNHDAISKSMEHKRRRLYAA